MNIMNVVFKRKYTEKNIIEILSDKPKTGYEIRNQLRSSIVTMLDLLEALVDKHIVGKRNRGSPNRPTWEYYLLDTSSIISKKTKFSNLTHSLK